MLQMQMGGVPTEGVHPHQSGAVLEKKTGAVGNVASARRLQHYPRQPLLGESEEHAQRAGSKIGADKKHRIALKKEWTWNSGESE